jgi:hypothetical protein
MSCVSGGVKVDHACSVTSSPSWSQLTPPPGALSGGEIEVLRLVATDMTNHAIQAVHQ